jgi:hypothetical protein
MGRSFVGVTVQAESNATGDGAAWHGNAGDLLIAGVAEVGESKIGAEAARGTAQRCVPDWIDRLLKALCEADSVDERESAGERRCL